MAEDAQSWSVQVVVVQHEVTLQDWSTEVEDSADLLTLGLTGVNINQVEERDFLLPSLSVNITVVVLGVHELATGAIWAESESME